MNPAQETRVLHTLMSVDRTLHDLKRVLDEDGAEELMFHWKNTVGSAQKKEIARLTGEAREIIRRLAKKHRLEAVEDSPIRSIWGALSTHWVAIQESKSATLRHYGDVDPELEETLDPDLERLSETVTRIQHELSADRHR